KSDIINVPEENSQRPVIKDINYSSAVNFPISYHDFLNEFYNRDSMKIYRIKETDINKFLEKKPVLSPEEVMHKLPMWLRDHNEAFLPQIADKLPPHRVWDHKIELIPGKEPPYNKNRPLSVPELKVVRKWLDENLKKGFIRESRARCAAPLLLAAKPGGGVSIAVDKRNSRRNFPR
ncbi:hypothetical protein K3495_g16799, partial [Podosphaera aphanis]